MNQLQGVIAEIQRSGSIMLVDVVCSGRNFTALMIDAPTPAPWLQVGTTVGLVFKETEVSLAVGLAGKLSLRNRLSCTVASIRRGELLSVIELLFQGQTIGSAITTRSADMLGLTPGCEVTALIKSNEIILTQL